MKPVSDLKPGTKAVLYVRVSTEEQERKDNLRDQEESLRAEMRRIGADVLDVVIREAGNGKAELLRPGAKRVQAARYALKHGAVLVAESPSRFLRHRDYDPKTFWQLRPTREDWLELQLWTGGVTLVAVARPDITPEEERGVQTRRGLEQKGAHPGHPVNKGPGYKKRRREKWKQVVIALRRDEKLSYREIQRRTRGPDFPKKGLSIRTLRDWLESAE